MPLTKIIRAYDLKPGDLFIKQGIQFWVRKIDKGIFILDYASGGSDCKQTIGMFSQERVELIT